MASTSWNDAEDEALEGLPLLAQVLYLRGLRAAMDYATGMVGRQPHGVSWRTLGNVLFVEPARGRSEHGSPTQKALRFAVNILERAGLVEVRSGDRELLFFLPLADRDESAQTNRGRRRADVGQTNRGSTNDSQVPDATVENGGGAGIQGRRRAEGGTPNRGRYPESGIEDKTPLTPRRKSKASAPEVPDGVEPDVWAEFERHRRELRKPLTPGSREKNAKVLRALSAADQRISVDTTISRGYTAVFPPKGGGGASGYAVGRTSAVAEFQRNNIIDFEREAGREPRG